REAHGRAGQEVRRGGRHDDQIGMLGEADVRERPVSLPQGGQDRAPGERLEGDCPDQLGRGGRKDHVHRRAVLGEPPGERAALVTRDPARHAEDDVPAGERHQPSWRRRRTSLYVSRPRTSSSNARVVSFASKSTDRSRGNSFTKRANLAATSTPRYLFWVWVATSLGVTIRITCSFALSTATVPLRARAPARSSSEYSPCHRPRAAPHPAAEPAR